MSSPTNWAQIEHAAFAGADWIVRLECINEKSNKFWEARGSGVNSKVEVSYGPRGSDGTTIIKDFAYVCKNLTKKLKKGYVYDMLSVISSPTPAKKKIYTPEREKAKKEFKSKFKKKLRSKKAPVKKKKSSPKTTNPPPSKAVLDFVRENQRFTALEMDAALEKIKTDSEKQAEKRRLGVNIEKKPKTPRKTKKQTVVPKPPSLKQMMQNRRKESDW